MENIKEKIIYYLTIYKNKIIIALFTIIFITISFIFLYINNYNKKENINNNTIEEITKKDKVMVKEDIKKEINLKTTEEPKFFYVDIKGEINKPGVYKIEEGKRINDVIKLAGGLTKNATTLINNLSRKVEDEMVIIIYSKDDIKELKKKKEEEKEIINNFKDEQDIILNDSVIELDKIDTNTNNDIPIINEEQKEEEKEQIDDNKDNKEENNEKISINQASKEELLNIKGIGEAKAEAIIKYRTENGNFKTIEDLKNVSGIGDTIFNKIKDFIII